MWASEACRARVDVIEHAFTAPAAIVDLAMALLRGRRDEVVYCLEQQDALVTGDVMLGGKDGGASFCPISWLAEGQTHIDLAQQLQPLAELDVRHLLLTHGRPLIGSGQAHIDLLLQAQKGSDK